MESDTQKERRLAREAQQNQLATLIVNADDVEEVTDAARVEVTFGDYDDDGNLEEHGGFVTVFIKDVGASHPADAARDAVYERFESEYGYFSVDDVYAA